MPRGAKFLKFTRTQTEIGCFPSNSNTTYLWDITSGRNKLLILYANQPLENCRGPTPHKSILLKCILCQIMWLLNVSVCNSSHFSIFLFCRILVFSNFQLQPLWSASKKWQLAWARSLPTLCAYFQADKFQVIKSCQFQKEVSLDSYISKKHSALQMQWNTRPLNVVNFYIYQLY